LRRTALAIALSTATIMAAHAQQPAGLTLEAAFARALEANPTIAAARLRRAVDLASVDVARERPNPEFRVEIEKEAPKEAYAFGVPLELGGKRERRIALAEAVVKSGEADLAMTILEVRAAVRHAYVARAGAEARLNLLNEIVDLAQRASDAARQRFEAGSAPRLESVQAELAFEQADNERTAAKAVASAARVQLNGLLALPANAETPLATPLDAPTLPPLETLMANVQASNAELMVLSRRIEEQRARASLARAMKTPDITPEATLTRRAEPEFSTGWRAALGITVPLFTKHEAGVRVEEATLAQVEGERAAAVARITADVSASLALADAQRQQFEQYRDRILPRALEVERMAEDSYRLGQTGINALLQALQATRDARLRALQAATDFQNTLADLERAMGFPLK
jgi:cobalt-zinc-cadmium efflux system outer membrane protein